MQRYKTIKSILHLARTGRCSNNFRSIVNSGRFSNSELFAIYLWDLHSHRSLRTMSTRAKLTVLRYA